KTGIFYFHRGLMSEAEREFRLCLSGFPNNASARKFLGMVLAKQGKNREALPILRSVVNKTKDDIELRLVLAQTLLNLGKKDKALSVLLDSGEKYPEEPNFAINAAILLIKRGDSKKAAACLKKLVAHHPDNLGLKRRAAELYCRIRDWHAARSLLLEEIEKEPNPQALRLLSQVCLNMGRKKEARRYLKKLSTMNIPDQVRQWVESRLKEL
ncbi:MAG: hypothetical protein DRG82_17465, partial [Deltaproteobacteria bacterium]